MEVEKLNAMIESMSQSDKLRLCAEMLDKRYEPKKAASIRKLAHAIVKRVTLELGAAIAHDEFQKSRAEP